MTAKDWEEYRFCGHGYRPDAAFECTVTPRDIHKIHPSEQGRVVQILRGKVLNLVMDYRTNDGWELTAPGGYGELFNLHGVCTISSSDLTPNVTPQGDRLMMNEQEKAAYILGLKDAIEQIEAELDMVSMEYKSLPLLLGAATTALMNAALLVEDQIAMTDGTRETKDK